MQKENILRWSIRPRATTSYSCALVYSLVNLVGSSNLKLSSNRYTPAHAFLNHLLFSCFTCSRAAHSRAQTYVLFKYCVIYLLFISYILSTLVHCDFLTILGNYLPYLAVV